MGEKFAVGATGNKKDKYVVAQAGTNLYFAIYENQDGERSFETMLLRVVLERKKQGLEPVPEKNDKEERLRFFLSPNDLVYVPTEEEIYQNMAICELDKKRIYRFINSSGTTANFAPHHFANLIYDVEKNIGEKYNNNNKIVLNEVGGSTKQSKNQKSLDGQMIKSVCWKLETDRLGNIIRIIK